MIDHEFGRRERIDSLRVAAEANDRFAHRGEIDDARDPGEVLHDDARRSEGDFVLRSTLWIPIEQRLDILAGDVDAILEAQQILEQDLERVRQAIDSWVGER